MFDLEFRDLSASDLGIKISYRPDMPVPVKNIEKTRIAGRDGELITTDNTYSDITISVDMNFVTEPERWFEHFITAKKWLSGKGNLKFSDSSGYFYKCKNASVDAVHRTVREAGEFTALFLCEPYVYIAAGQNEYAPKDVKLNPYMMSKPKYIITGTGKCTLTVNGKTITANVNGNLTIDTNFMIAYESGGVMRNTAISGNYEDVYLQEGINDISITSGFGLKVIPNWRVL